MITTTRFILTLTIILLMTAWTACDSNQLLEPGDEVNQSIAIESPNKAAANSNGLMRFRVPEEMGLPYYARTDAPFDFHDESWAVIVFYRSPEQVPSDFDLLGFFDFGVFGDDDMTVSGHVLTYDPFEAPKQIRLTGNNVPVWFIPWTVMEGLLANNQLTMAELADAEVYKGYASHFSETLHPTGGHNNAKLVLQARGNLDDGRTFSYHLVRMQLPNETDLVVHIDISVH